MPDLPESDTTELSPPAGFLRRMGGCLYDGLILVALWMTVTALYLGILAAIMGEPALKSATSGGETPGQPLLTLILLCCTFGFFGYFWRRSGQTLGMQSWRMRLETSDGTTLSWRRCMIRFCIAIVSWLFFGLGFLGMFWDQNRRTWHDRMSCSRIVRLPSRQSR